MNIVNKVTVRHLKQNKRRTLVTIIGVIISVAMIMAVATLGVSFLDLFKRQTIVTEGEWHVLYNDVNRKQLEAIKKDQETEKVVLSKAIGYAPLEGSENENKPYLFLKAYNALGFKQFPIELIDGRLPQTDKEVVISEEIGKNAKIHYKMGDRLSLQVGERQVADDQSGLLVLSQNDPLKMENGEIIESLSEKTTASYTVVGVVKRPLSEPTWAPGYTIFTYLDESTLNAHDTADASVVLKKVNRSLYAHAEKLAKENGINAFYYNNGLLRYYGVTNNDNLHATLLGISSVIMTVIIVGSVSLIYNAFAISVSERSRHLGMLSSVGATKRQKRNSVFFEGFVIGLISIPIGLLAGMAGLSITFFFINSMIQGALGVTERLEVVLTPLTVLVACCVSIITIFISTYIPAARASKVSAIDAIRQSMDVKLTGKAIKTSKLVRKIFGFEAEIGLKNLKRNKRRYQATVFSLVISIVLFLAVSFFTENLKKSLVLSQDGINFDIQVTKYNGMSQSDEELLHSFAGLDSVTDSTFIKTASVNSWIEEEDVADRLKDDIQNDKSLLADGKYSYYIMIHALDQKSLQEYAKSIGASYQRLIEKDNLSGIVIDTIPYEDNQAEQYAEIKAIQKNIGESIDLHYTDMETNEEKELPSIKIAGLTDQHPMGIFPSGLGGLNIIVSEEVFSKIIGSNEVPDHYASLYLKSTDPMATQQEIEELKDSNMHVRNIYLGRQQEEQMLMIMSVFTYGFIVLITLISIANIFNTISTSISLRKREFAMLKSVGMTPKGFNKMINYESVFYGMKSLLYGLPISVAVMYAIHRSLMNSFNYSFTLPWVSIVYVIAAVFIIVGAAMLYSSAKVKKENIIDALKQENI